MVIENKKRIEWIDTAKGICIFLVVLYHVSLYTNSSYPFSSVFVTFRMPLYFILSGLFFKRYNGIKSFTVKKINKLLVPYIFFFFISGIIIPILSFHFFHHRIWYYSDYGIWAILSIFSENNMCNHYIWFLQCLFEVNIIFYTIVLLSLYFKKPTFIILLMSITCGIIGLLLDSLGIKKLYYWDSTLSATPFFCFGWYLRNRTDFLSMNNSKTNVILSSIFILFTTFIIFRYNYGNCNFIFNTFGGILGYIQLYPYGIMGTISVLALSRMIGRIPIVSYCGQYSIIILCTHAYTIHFSAIILSYFIKQDSMMIYPTFILTILLSLILIPIFVKFLPYFTAQKDIIRIYS